MRMLISQVHPDLPSRRSALEPDAASCDSRVSFLQAGYLLNESGDRLKTAPELEKQLLASQTNAFCKRILLPDNTLPEQ